MTWDEAYVKQKIPVSLRCDDTYKEGFRSGWFDVYLGHDSMIARTSTWGQYAIGYSDGRASYMECNPVIKIEGDITCLVNLLG